MCIRDRFGLWQGEGQLTEEKVWKRLKLAAEARNYSLASHLAQRLPTLGNQGALMVSVCLLYTSRCV